MEQNRSVRNCAFKTCSAPNGFDRMKDARNADSLIHAETARLAVNDPGRSAVHWWLVLGYADRTSAEN